MSAAANSPWFVCRQPRPNAQVRIVCFPHGGGGPQSYATWGSELSEFIDVVAVAPPGRGARHGEVSIDSMEALTDALASALPPILDRPFAFFGHSVGALVAFALVRKMRSLKMPAPLRLFLSSYAFPKTALCTSPMHMLNDEDLLHAIKSFGVLAHDAKLDGDLRQLILSPVRADFKLAETYRFDDEPALDSSITVLGGRNDPIVTVDDLSAWRTQTSANFTNLLFNGDHFYTQTHQSELLKTISRTLEKDIASLPPSVALDAQEDYPLDQCVHDLFRKVAERTPDVPALVGVDRTLTFADLDQDSDLIARHLVSMGCGPDKVVCILMETHVNFVVACLAVLKAGGAFLPIDPATPNALLSQTLSEAKTVCVIAQEGVQVRLTNVWDQSKCIFLRDNGAMVLPDEVLPVPENPSSTQPESLAFCVSTSGTTGHPKIISYPHKGIVNSYWWRYQHLPYETGEREACNIFFVWEVLRPLLHGEPAYIIPDDVVFDPRRLLSFLRENRITRVLVTPSLLGQILNESGDGKRISLPDLRIIYLNGEVVTAALAQRCTEILPHVRLINDYSIAECHDVATGEVALSPHADGRAFVPVGKPMANVRVYVLDENKRPLPLGVKGEIYVAGPTLARGYLHQPELTAERFLTDPFQSAGEQMFRTGDMGRLRDDGQLEIFGRAHFMVKLRGYSVVLEAVEAALMSHAEVSAAAVAVVNDQKTGQPDHLVAVVAGHNGAPTEATIERLRDYLKQYVPHYAIPARILARHALRLSETTGKVDRNRLIDDEDDTKVTADSKHLRTLDHNVACMWKTILNVASISPGDNFFDLGGHSLKAIELTRAIERDLRVTLNVVDVFEHPTLERFCKFIADNKIDRPSTRGGHAHRSERNQDSRDIAVIGMACRFPGAGNPHELWKNISSGVESISRLDIRKLRAQGIPADLISNENYIKAGATLEDVALFDAKFWGLSARDAVLMDPQHRLFLECCWHALEDAGFTPGERECDTGVFAGCYMPTYLIHHLGAKRYINARDPTTIHLAEVGNDKDYLASRVAYHLNLTGPAVNIQTSCSTGLVTVAEAVQALRNGECETALAGAASITFPQAGYLYVEGHIGSRSGSCRTFDAAADGTVLGDGVGVVVLKRLNQALADGDDIRAVIKGIGVNNDGALRAGFSAPGVRGQADVIKAALSDAQIHAETISYVEAHGTGTILGDPIEVSALTSAFRQQTDRKGFCALGSIKPNIGHSNIASGIAGFIKVVLALTHRCIPPQINFSVPNPHLQLSSTPFYVTKDAIDWDVDADDRRRAGVSSFGIGGTNAHILLEEAPEQTSKHSTQRKRALSPLTTFSRQRYWPDPDDAVDAPSQFEHLSNAETLLPLEQRFYTASWRRTTAPVVSEKDASGSVSSSARFILLLDAEGTTGTLGNALSDKLREKGLDIACYYRRFDTETDEASSDLGWQEAVNAIKEEVESGDGRDIRVLYLWPLRQVERKTPATEAVTPIAGLLKYLVQARIDQSVAVWVLGVGGVSVVDEAPNPPCAGIVGQVLVASQEHPALDVRYIDLQLPKQRRTDAIGLLAEQIMRECSAVRPRAEPVVALRGRYKFVEQLNRTALDPDARHRGRKLLRTCGTHIITGGLGRIGLVLARHLCRLGCNVILTTRADFPDPEQWRSILAASCSDPKLCQTIRTLQDVSNGPGRIRVETVDLRSANGTSEFLQKTIAEFGPVGGIFHAAGLADLRYLTDVLPEHYANEFDPKLSGAACLAQAMTKLESAAKPTPKFVVAFSSLAGILGGLGMSAYASANRAMDAFVSAQADKSNTRWLSINWDDWDFDYTKEQVSAYEKTRSQFAMSAEDGLSALEMILGYDDLVQVMVATTCLEYRAKRWLNRHHVERDEMQHPSSFPNPARVAVTQNARTVEEQLIAAYAKVLGNIEINREDDFFALGGDSLHATQIVLELDRVLPPAMRVTITDVLDYPTIEGLAAKIVHGSCDHALKTAAAGS